MTGKSILMDSSPDFIRCKEAGKRLYQQLESQGFELTGVGVGVNATRTAPTIYIMLHHKPKSPKVPSEFEGFKVDIAVTGTIRFLAKDA